MAAMVYILIILAASLAGLPLWAELLRMAGHLEINYRGRSVPQSMGAVYPPVFLLAALWARWTGLLGAEIVARMSVVVLGLGIIGLVDDIWGDKRVKGFAGHFRSLLRGRITTGFIKAAAGFLVCLWAVAGLPGFFLLAFWRAVVVALSANLLNLLDLRPGRALKGFFAVTLLYSVTAASEPGILLLMPFLLASLAYLPRDLQGSGMLGDTGANVLGGALGLVIVMTAPAIFQVFYFLTLIVVHLAAERISLNHLITQNRVLYFFDHLGRHEWEK
jgi:UDP-GlcNAc:undecaprenyl-phosphate/decaprenyl-phosphate GlcNAc-1-phosphate transferase